MTGTIKYRRVTEELVPAQFNGLLQHTANNTDNNQLITDMHPLNLGSYAFSLRLLCFCVNSLVLCSEANVRLNLSAGCVKFCLALLCSGLVGLWSFKVVTWSVWLQIRGNDSMKQLKHQLFVPHPGVISACQQSTACLVPNCLSDYIYLSSRLTRRDAYCINKR